MTLSGARRLMALMMTTVAILSSMAIGQRVGVTAPLDGERLLQLFATRLAGQPPAEDLLASQANERRLELHVQPSLRLRQDSAWYFGAGSSFRLGIDLRFPLYDEPARVQLELAQQRSLLARHNAAAERQYRLYEFKRNLSMLAHLQRVTNLLAAHRSELLARWPSLRSLDGAGQFSRVVAGQEIAYLEVVQALRQATGEYELLARQVSSQTGLLPQQILAIGRDRLAIAESGKPALAKMECTTETDETVRAQLLLREQQRLAELTAARREPQVTLELSGSGERLSGATGPAWDAGVRAALRVTLPTGGETGATIAVDVTATSLSQQASFSYPGVGHDPQLPTVERARLAYRLTIDEAQQALASAHNTIEVARTALTIRRLRLEELNRVVAAGGQVSIELLNSRAQAHVEMSAARLELELARLNLIRACGPVGRQSGAHDGDVPL